MGTWGPGWLSGFGLIGFAGTMVACSEPRCPSGYVQVGNICHLFKDAGPDAADSDADESDDDAGSGDADDTGAADGDASANGGDARASSADANLSSVDASAAAEAMASLDASGAAPSQLSCASPCGAHETCRAQNDAAVCACVEGYQACTSGCVDLTSDPQNCGACGYACESGLSCKQSNCEQKIHRLVLGGKSSCALYEAADGSYPVKCWGDTSGQLFRDTSTEALTPRSIVGVPKVRDLAISKVNWQCAVLSDRDVVRCWGFCDKACGNSGASALSDAFFDNAVTAVTDVHLGNIATCAYSGLGIMSCWGNASMIAADADRSSPVGTTVGGQSVLSEVSLAGTHGCAVAQNKGVICWGSNAFGELGAVADASSGKSGVFVLRETGGELTGIVHVYAGEFRNCAVTTTGEVWCWGENGTHTVGSLATGSLGAGDQAEHVGAVQVNLADATDVTLGAYQTCAIVRGGQAYCWGTAGLVGSGGGASGNGTGNLFTTPQLVPGLDDVIEIRAGAAHTCARRRTGQVVCWGNNDKGQLGDGTQVARAAPTPVVGLY